MDPFEDNTHIDQHSQNEAEVDDTLALEEQNASESGAEQIQFGSTNIDSRDIIDNSNDEIIINDQHPQIGLLPVVAEESSLITGPLTTSQNDLIDANSLLNTNQSEQSFESTIPLVPDYQYNSLSSYETSITLPANVAYTNPTQEQQDDSLISYQQYQNNEQQSTSFLTDTNNQQQSNTTINPIDNIKEDENSLIKIDESQEATDQLAFVSGDSDIDIIEKQRGVAEHGSFRRKVNNNQADTSPQSTHNQTSPVAIDESEVEDIDEESGGRQSKFKRALSVSFNVNSSSRGRNSIDIRNLPSYLQHKRVSIVDVAKGAVSSLLSSTFGSSHSNHHIDSLPEEPLFEEPIAPTLSLGQRVALIKDNGSEFGTVGWIGRLPDFDKDWIVGVIFDNQIGNSDGEFNGIRYFYARRNYAMFVPLSVLTKTDNYIGRPETGTMLSRMSIQLKPGQLISIQRSSLRLQHCFLNAPHQRVGHDVRAVSNRLHCQCHNCGPCAHLTKQGRGVNPLAGISAHHGPNPHAKHAHGKHAKHANKNSLAHMAIELLAHHHHHLEESHEEPEYRFGDNSAHACNFVRYSCCLQAQSKQHQPAGDCSMIRPEILDNLITAPRGPTKMRASSRSFKSRRSTKSNEIECYNTTNNDLIPTMDDQFVKSWLESSVTNENIAQSNIANESHIQRTGSACSSCSLSSSSRNSLDLDEDEFGTANNRRHIQSTNSFSMSTWDAKMSIADQRRFIFKHDSTTIMSQSSFESEPIGLFRRARNCLRCLIGRRAKSPKRSKKMSKRERSLEHRRRNSTFVPSTLAKPQDDFATHDLPYPITTDLLFNPSSLDTYNNFGNININSADISDVNNIEDSSFQTSQNYQNNILSSLNTNEQYFNEKNDSNPGFIDEDNAKASSMSSLKITDQGEKLEATDQINDFEDLGFYGSQNNSNDTLKKIVEDSVNEKVEEWIPTAAFDLGVNLISPVTSSRDSVQIDISSPTMSLVEQTESEDAIIEAVEKVSLNDDEV